MAKRKLSKEERRKRMGLSYSFLGKPEILEPPKTRSEKQKAEELEKERQEALKKRLKKEKEKRKGRTVEAVNLVISEQEEEYSRQQMRRRGALLRLRRKRLGRR